MSGTLRVLVAVICSTLGSLVVIAIYAWLVDMPMPPSAWAATILCPVLISAPVSWILILQGERVRRLNEDLRVAYAELDRVASTDDLTGIANRRAFFETASAAARRGGEDWLLLADIDHFKSINDRFGHERGDAYLTAVARTLRDAARPSDVVGRLGGEEFAVLLRGASRVDAQKIADGARADVASLTLTSEDGRAIATTLSIGLTACMAGATLHDDLKRADDALYHAKRQGRDQVRLRDEPGLLIAYEPARVVSIRRRPG